VKTFQYCGVALPGVTVALVTPIEPLQQNPDGFVEELLQASDVAMDSVVIVIPPEFGVEPLEQYWQPQVAVLLAPRNEALARGPQFLPGGPAFEVMSPPRDEGVMSTA
jgi:hypothetical protein